MAKKIPKPKSSSVRLRESGLRPVQLWLTPEQHEKLFAAAQIDGRKGTQFLLHHALTAAERILSKVVPNA